MAPSCRENVSIIIQKRGFEAGLTETSKYTCINLGVSSLRSSGFSKCMATLAQSPPLFHKRYLKRSRKIRHFSAGQQGLHVRARKISERKST